jgi:peptidoglycan/xylan/chitin deacetylase (PgdA/CDA1 family)
MKKLFFNLLYWAGISSFAAWYNRRRIVFLCYHGVTRRDRRRATDPTGLHVNHRRFAEQLDYLSRRYNIISLRDYLSARADGRPLPNYSLVLTFDDGFRNFRSVALPLLVARGLPATVFLITGNADHNSEVNLADSWRPEDDQSYLSWPEALKIKDSYGIDFGSHTCSHSPLLSLPIEGITRELGESRDELSRNLSIEKPALSYPKGERSQMLADQARRQGYCCAVTTDRGANEADHDLYTLGRTLIGDDDDRASLAVRVSGLRHWLAWIWDRIPFGSSRANSQVKVGKISRDVDFQLD